MCSDNFSSFSTCIFLSVQFGPVTKQFPYQSNLFSYNIDNCFQCGAFRWFCLLIKMENINVIWNRKLARGKRRQEC